MTLSVAPSPPPRGAPRPAAHAPQRDETGGLGQEGCLHACVQHPDSDAFFQLSAFVCPPPLRVDAGESQGLQAFLFRCF